MKIEENSIVRFTTPCPKQAGTTELADIEPLSIHRLAATSSLAQSAMKGRGAGDTFDVTATPEEGLRRALGGPGSVPRSTSMARS
jgi:hypothetical protein